MAFFVFIPAFLLVTMAPSKTGAGVVGGKRLKAAVRSPGSGVCCVARGQSAPGDRAPFPAKGKGGG